MSIHSCNTALWGSTLCLRSVNTFHRLIQSLDESRSSHESNQNHLPVWAEGQPREVPFYFCCSWGQQPVLQGLQHLPWVPQYLSCIQLSFADWHKGELTNWVNPAKSYKYLQHHWRFYTRGAGRGWDKSYENYLKMLCGTLSYCRSDPALSIETITCPNFSTPLLPVLLGRYWGDIREMFLPRVGTAWNLTATIN